MSVGERKKGEDVLISGGIAVIVTPAVMDRPTACAGLVVILSGAVRSPLHHRKTAGHESETGK